MSASTAATPTNHKLALPDGWKREEVKRTGGLSSGKIDVVYTSPDGCRIKSKVALSKYLGPEIDLFTFDYRSGRINSSLIRKNNKRAALRASPNLYDYRSLRNDPSLLAPPTRLTASAMASLRKPVTLIKSQSESISLANNAQIREYFKKEQHPILQDHKFSDSERNAPSKPCQLFWAKRFKGQKPTIVSKTESTDYELLAQLTLPESMKAFSELVDDNEVLVHSLSASIVSTPSVSAIKGQEKNALDKKKRSNYDDDLPRNPAVWVNPQQPLVQMPNPLGEEDLKRQQAKVATVRQQLVEAIKSF